MKYRTISVDVDMDLGDFDDDDLIDELEDRGYTVNKENMDFSREEILYMEEIMEKLPYSYMNRNIIEKLRTL